MILNRKIYKRVLTVRTLMVKPGIKKSFVSKVVKIGNSEGITIPREERKELDVAVGDLVRITAKKVKVQDA